MIMKFEKHIKLEEQQMLKNLLANYEQEKPMTSNEKIEVRKWVRSGNDPYSNGYGYCFENGNIMDFIEAERTNKELSEQQAD